MSEIKGFGPKLKRLLAPESYVHDLGGSFDVLGDEGEIHVTQHRASKFNFAEVEKLFFQLGNYFELIEPVPEPVEPEHAEAAQTDYYMSL